MKAQTKMIAASLVVIMLALSALGGVTYSWFSDTDESEINVTTGTITVDSSFSTPYVTYSNGYIDDENMGIGTTALASNGNLTVSNLVPNRTISTNYDISIDHSVPVKYRVYLDLSQLVDYKNFLTIFVDSEPITISNIVYLRGGSNQIVLGESNIGIPIEIVVSETAKIGNLPSSFVIKATVEVYQADASVSPVETVSISLGTGQTLSKNSPALMAKDDTIENGIKSSEVVFDSSSAGYLDGKKLTIGYNNDANFDVNGAKISLTVVDPTNPDENISKLGGTATITVGINGNVINPVVSYVEGGNLVEEMDVVNCVYNASERVTYVTFITTHFSDFLIEGIFFDSGDGSENNPYIIASKDQIKNISHHYESGDSGPRYYKVKDGITELDMTNIGRLMLNGSFNGNGVTMNNLTTALFEYVGKVGNEQKITISNLTANVKNIDGRALVRNIYNPGITTFENVAIHGYIEGKYNMGSFYNYGTANASGSEGADYTVKFVNATSNAMLVCTSGNIIGGMLGHGYEGKGHKLNIYMDDNSKYTGKMVTTTDNKCHHLMAMCSNASYYLNGVYIEGYSDTYDSTKLTRVDPTIGEGGYYVNPVEGVDHYIVSLEAQMSAYDGSEKIPNLAGMTWSLGKKEISENYADKIFDLVSTAEIVNNKNYSIGYELNDGYLIVYSGRDTNYVSGTITLNVTQYDANDNILATGNLKVYEFKEP